jgi:hypothetical protein
MAPTAGADRLVLGYCSDVSRRELIERVLTGLPASSDSVAYPDHPLLLQAPDILASVNGTLTAFFVLDQRVRRLPARVLSNVVLSRLALPRGTNFVLILGEDASIRSSDSTLFEEVVEISGKRYRRIPLGRMSESASAELMEPLRRPHDERFAQAWASTARRRAVPHRTYGEPTSVRVFRTHPPRVSYMDFQNGQFILTAPGPASRTSVRQLLSNSAHVAVQTDYWLDLGVPGLAEVAQLIRSRNAHLALHKSWVPLPSEAHQFDALKPFRAAAFAGFAVRPE